MENLPTNAINLIFRFVSHPVSDIIKPHITTRPDDTIRSIQYKRLYEKTYYPSKQDALKKIGSYRYYHSKQYDSSEHKDFKDHVVISRHIRNRINKQYISEDDLLVFDETFLFINEYIIEEVLKTDSNKFIQALLTIGSNMRASYMKNYSNRFLDRNTMQSHELLYGSL